MSAARQRISARDYKNAGRRGRFDIARYQQFGVGLALGLAVALGVFVFDHRASMPEEETVPKAQPAKKAATDALGAESEDPVEQYDFYDMLPKSGAVVAVQERDVRRDQPSVPIELPGAYVVQVGSFKNEEEAERQRLKLSKLGIDAALQRIAVDDDVRHRVRVGPLRDLPKLNAIRRQLRAADMDAILIRLGD